MEDAAQDVLPWADVERICWKVARKLWHNDTLDCEDLVQEALLYLWEKGGTTAGVSMSSGLVGTVTERKMIDRIRQWTHVHRRSKTVPQHVSIDVAFGQTRDFAPQEYFLNLALPDSCDGIAAELDAAAALAALPKKQRRDLLLIAIGYSAIEIATARGVARESVHHNTHVAHQRLRDAL